MQIGRARKGKTCEMLSIFRMRKFYIVKEKNTLDLPIFSQIDKILRKLQRILNATVNTSILAII